MLSMLESGIVRVEREKSPLEKCRLAPLIAHEVERERIADSAQASKKSAAIAPSGNSIGTLCCCKNEESEYARQAAPREISRA